MSTDLSKSQNCSPTSESFENGFDMGFQIGASQHSATQRISRQRNTFQRTFFREKENVSNYN